MTGLAATQSENGHANGHSNGTANGHSKETSPFMNDQIPISPSAPQKVPGLLDQISSHGDAFLSADPDARLKLLEDARALVNALETPRESMIRYCWAQVCGLTYTRNGTIAHRPPWNSQRSTRPSRPASILISSTSCRVVIGPSLLRS